MLANIVHTPFTLSYFESHPVVTMKVKKKKKIFLNIKKLRI
jgi:hypothetical protein